MYIIKKFLEEKRGAGIVEYILLLCFLGSVVVVVSPPLREQVGIMYENQVNSTNELNGMVDSQNSSGIDIDSTATAPKTPNSSVKNPGTIVATPDPTPTEVAPLTKNVVVEVKNYKNLFEDQIEYSKDGYQGILSKDPNGLTTTVVDSQDKTLSKDVSVIIKRSTVEEFDSIPNINETDAEGYTGMLNPVGDVVASYELDEENSGVVTKPSGTVYLTAETTSTDANYINSLFPDEYLYKEIDSQTNTESGYEGNLLKLGAYTSTIIGQETKEDSKDATSKNTFFKEVDVNDSAVLKEHDVKSAEIGTVETNPNSYPSTYKYNDGTKEGILQYDSKYSVLVDTVTEGKSVTVTPTFNYSPGKYYTYNVDGYFGSFDATSDAVVTSGSYVPEDTKFVTDQTSSSYNVSGYSGTLSSYVYSGSYTAGNSKYVSAQLNSWYSDAAGYSGSLSSYLYSGSPANSQTVSKVGRATSGVCHSGMGAGWKNCDDDRYAPESIEYDSGGYSGTLSTMNYVYWSSSYYTRSDGNQAFDWTRTWTYSGVVYSEDTRVYRYRGTVYSSAVDTREYRYEGNVTRPATDTRVWSRTYAGNAYKTTKYYEYYGKYKGSIFNIAAIDPNGAPATVNYTDAQDYTGTLNKKAGTQTRSLESVRSVTFSKGIIEHKIYEPGLYTMSTNNKYYQPTYEYSDGVRTTGTLNSPVKGTEFSHTGPAEQQAYVAKKSFTNSFAETIPYDSGGYTGTLSKSDTPYYYNEKKNVAPVVTYYSGEQCIDNVIVTSPTARPQTHEYNELGFTGTLSFVSEKYVDYVEGSCYNSDGVWTGYGAAVYDVSYSGEVSKTTWVQEYSGMSYGPMTDYYKHFVTYTGNVYEERYYAGYRYAADYEGKIYKSIQIDKYRYEQPYSGTLAKGSYEFTEGYEREYAGTLFKTIQEELVEYKQSYSGTVTEIK